MSADAPLPPSLQRAADRLARTLAAQNRAVYRRALADHAAAFGQTAPRHVQSRQVKDAIAQRAQASAESITRTHMQARQRFYEQASTVDEAKMLYKQWTADRADAVASFEAGQTAGAAARDFQARNADVLSGEEFIEPDDSSGDEVCAGAIAMGRQAIGTLDPPPFHVNCIHVLTREYTPLSDPSALWVGGADDGDQDEEE